MKKFIKRLLKLLLPESMYGLLASCHRRIRSLLRNIAIHIKLALNLPTKHRQKRINFGFHVTEHCNLNCASCNNFSPLAEVEFINIDDFRRDIERMGVLFNHVCDKIRLLGGEPLLHPEIISIMETARKNFHTGQVRLLTNGILLTQQGPEFWRACHDNRITIVVTHYPINIDVLKIRQLAEEFDVELECADEPVKDFIDEPINLKGDGDCKRNFALCGRANNCPLIRHGRLYTCTFAPNIHHFSKKFNVDIPIIDADSIDIHDDNMTSDEILRRLIEPIPACRFCNMNVKQITWHRSEQDINEWL